MVEGSKNQGVGLRPIDELFSQYQSDFAVVPVKIFLEQRQDILGENFLYGQ